MCVYTLKSLELAPGRLLLQLTVYVHSGDQPPSTDINSGRRDTTTMCESSLTVNISLAVHLSAALPASARILKRCGLGQPWFMCFSASGAVVDYCTCQRVSVLSTKKCRCT